MPWRSTSHIIIILIIKTAIYNYIYIGQVTAGTVSQSLCLTG